MRCPLWTSVSLFKEGLLFHVPCEFSGLLLRNVNLVAIIQQQYYALYIPTMVTYTKMLDSSRVFGRSSFNAGLRYHVPCMSQIPVLRTPTVFASLECTVLVIHLSVSSGHNLYPQLFSFLLPPLKLKEKAIILVSALELNLVVFSDETHNQGRWSIE